jgi:hypothetical protein
VRRATGEKEAKVVSFVGGDDAKGGASGGRDGRRRSCCKDEGAGLVREDRTKVRGAGDECAGRSQGLTEGSDEDVGFAAELGAKSTARGPEGAKGMSLVDHEGSVVPGSELGKRG